MVTASCLDNRHESERLTGRIEGIRDVIAHTVGRVLDPLDIYASQMSAGSRSKAW